MAVSAFARLALGCASSVVLLAAGVAAAQDQGSATPSTPPPGAPAATPPPPAPTTGELVVTGSRIRRTTAYNTAAPVQIITPDDGKAAGIIDPATALQHSALAAGSVQVNNQFGNFVVNGGAGVDTISLRGLGSQRTLVLLNGRRTQSGRGQRHGGGGRPQHHSGRHGRPL